MQRAIVEHQLAEVEVTVIPGMTRPTFVLDHGQVVLVTRSFTLPPNLGAGPYPAPTRFVLRGAPPGAIRRAQCDLPAGCD